MIEVNEAGLIERVARSICRAEGFNPDAVVNRMQEHPNWVLYRDGARAAIATIREALKEPTDEMHARGVETAEWYGMSVSRIFTEMLAASPLVKEEP